ncbi:hypothetical protein ADICYQ_2873 [Cyclobacterium qasimii M12-11B]|uniref:Uncharacterized protein n=1 Tax=Cyclobacterium qasimii M12-11B TaxID=641524 RepID=S7WVS0_9BACT|nr:hypothetical protein ADICYQ_2873 [Cyclobacterium qasimii M12-11B]
MNKFRINQKMEILSSKSIWGFSLLILFLMIPGFSQGQTETLSTPSDSIMITIMMKHHQDKNIEELTEIRNKNGFFREFPSSFCSRNQLVRDDGHWSGGYFKNTC